MGYIARIVFSVCVGLAGAFYVEKALDYEPRNIEQEIVSEVKDFYYQQDCSRRQKEESEKRERECYSAISDLRKALDINPEEARRGALRQVINSHQWISVLNCLSQANIGVGGGNLEDAIDYLTFGCSREEWEIEEEVKNYPPSMQPALRGAGRAGRAMRNIRFQWPGRGSMENFPPTPTINLSDPSDPLLPPTIEDLKRKFDVYLSNH